jgi:hypothetical protein
MNSHRASVLTVRIPPPPAELRVFLSEKTGSFRAVSSRNGYVVLREAHEGCTIVDKRFLIKRVPVCTLVESKLKVLRYGMEQKGLRRSR